MAYELWPRTAVVSMVSRERTLALKSKQLGSVSSCLLYGAQVHLSNEIMLSPSCYSPPLACSEKPGRSAPLCFFAKELISSCPSKELFSESHLTQQISGQLIKNPLLTRLQGIFHLLSSQGKKTNPQYCKKNKTGEIVIILAHCALQVFCLFLSPFNI